jgi:negative regulator of flagellin synthesis FlgM
MHIYGTSHIHGAHSVNAPHTARPSEQTLPSRPFSAADELHLSEEALLAGDISEISSRLSEIPDIRTDRVNALRQAIAQGTYETADKLDMALDRLLDEIG